MAEEKPKIVRAGRGRNMGPMPKLKDPMGTFKRVVGFSFGDHKVGTAVVVVCLIIAIISNLVGAVFPGLLISEFLTPFTENGKNVDFDALFKVISVVAVMYLIGVVASYVQNRIMMFITQGSLNKFRLRLFKKMERLPIKYFDTHAHGDIMSVYTNDVDALRQMISMSMPQFLQSAITIVGVLGAMIWISIPLTITALITIFIMLTVTGKVASKSGENFVLQQKNLGMINGYIEEMMEGQKVVKVFCYEEKGKERFDELNENLYDSASKANKYVNIIAPINAQMGNVGFVISVIVGGLLAINGVGGLELGNVVSFANLYRMILMPVNQVTQQLNSVVMALAAGERVFDLLDETPEVDEGYVTLVNCKEENGQIVETLERTGRWAWKHFHKAEGTTTYVEVKGDVVFDGVDFGYTDEKMVLHDIELHALPGQKIAFVGSTGAGGSPISLTLPLVAMLPILVLKPSVART